MNEKAKWYVVHTYSGYENKVAQDIKKVVETKNLQELIKEVRIPVEKLEEIKNGKAREVERKLFPSYVIIKMVLTNETWYAVKNVRGVSGFVGPSLKPIPLTEKEVENLEIEKHAVETDYKIGDCVRILSGSLEGFTGKVSEVNMEKGLATVVVSIFGKDTPAEVELERIVPDV